MKTLLAILILFVGNLVWAENFPHEVLTQCTVKMQRLGFTKEASNESCSISAGGTCSLMESFIVQKDYPNCVGEAIYLRVPATYAMQFCNMAARRQAECSPRQYILDREKFIHCLANDLRSGELANVLNSCLEKVLKP